MSFIVKSFCQEVLSFEICDISRQVLLLMLASLSPHFVHLPAPPAPRNAVLVAAAAACYAVPRFQSHCRRG